MRPVRQQRDRDTLVVHTNFRLPRRHRLFDDLIALRSNLSDRLRIPLSEETIDIYLFDDEQRFRKVLRDRFPDLADRRALFCKSGARLQIYGLWGDHLAEDLRHEATHAYLHSALPDIPLWLDEGLAEYFEVEPAMDGCHERHVRWLVRQYQQRHWTPNLNRLESLTRPHELTQTDYAEAWLWVHFLLHDSAETSELFHASIANLQNADRGASLVETILARVPNAGGRVLDHLKSLAERCSETVLPTANIDQP